MSMNSRVLWRRWFPTVVRRRIDLVCEPLERRNMLSANGDNLHDHHASHEHAEDTHSSDQGEVCASPISGITDRLDLELLPLTDLRLLQTFQLHSLRSARHRIYLDFNGHTTTNTAWNKKYTADADFTSPAYSVDTNPSFSNVELTNIQDIWSRVAETFAPFDIDVTTEAPTLLFGTRVVIGGSSDQWLGKQSGGVAFVGGFAFPWKVETPAFVFSDNTGKGSPSAVATAVSHEIGHTLGLAHDGQAAIFGTATEYYNGHGSGETSWAPIMGNGYDAQILQWSRGEYFFANNKQDDLAIITSKNGFGFRPDDYGNTLTTATFVATPGGSAVFNGIITQQTDVDVVRFFTHDKLKVKITPKAPGASLDVVARIWNASGKQIASSNPTNMLSAAFDLMLPPGFYSLAIRGTGKGTANDGYTAYGSLGSYSVSVETNPQPPLVSIAATDAVIAEGNAGSKAFSFTATRSGSTTGTTTATWKTLAKAGSAVTAADFAGGVFPSGKVTFVPGQTTALINVFVAGDSVLELDEPFAVTLTKVTLGSIGTATATGTIQNDDLYRTSFLLVATAARLMEGNANFTQFVFAVTRSGTVNTTHSVKWAVAGIGSSSANAGDFVGDKLPFGTLTFSPGESLKKITVLVRADLVVEQNESFLVKLSNLIGSGGGIVVDAVGGLIMNDDRARP